MTQTFDREYINPWEDLEEEESPEYLGQGFFEMPPGRWQLVKGGGKSLSVPVLTHHSDVEPQYLRGSETVRDRFQRWSSQVELDTQYLSSMQDVAMHPAYQRVIGLGLEVMPYLLESLKENPGRWIWAVNAIAGEDAAEGCESFEEAKECWLAWGRRFGYTE